VGDDTLTGEAPALAAFGAESIVTSFDTFAAQPPCIERWALLDVMSCGGSGAI
jgi:hypothetical protein